MQRAKASGLGGEEVSYESFRKWLKRRQSTEIRGSGSQVMDGRRWCCRHGWGTKEGKEPLVTVHGNHRLSAWSLAKDVVVADAAQARVIREVWQRETRGWEEVVQEGWDGNFI